MKKRSLSALAAVAVGALAVTGLAAPLQANALPQSQAKIGGDPAEAQSARRDNLPNPLAERQAERRKDAVAKLVKGQASTKVINGNRVIEVQSKDKSGKKGKSRFVNYPVDRRESIFTILSEFGTATDPATGGTPGPMHNQIPKPDRVWDGSSTDDNTTYWVPDFNRAHYLQMMFGAKDSFKDFYTKQSNGRFSANGDVSNWVKLPYNEARYGSNKVPEQQTYWPFVRDTAASWYASQKAAGKSDAAIKTYLAKFDKVDRYDYDGDGNFNEPDGYIDHFQAIHAGEGEEAGGGAQGEDAIWSHRWYAYSTDIGKSGPSFNKLGGVPLGNTGLWIGDYTTEPENGGLGVFAHEFGHDLGLPDLYDTAGGDNGTGFWTLMSAGSWLNPGKYAIGTKPGYMGPWEKLQLGWLDYDVVAPGATPKKVTVGPAARVVKVPDADGKLPQAIVVPLPNKTVTTVYNTPHSGKAEWWGGSADNLNSTLSRTIDLTGATSSASVSAWVQSDIEEGYDYLYGEASTDGGTTWTQVGTPITGKADWTLTTWDLSAYVGKSVQFRFRYYTDGGVHNPGAFIDDITVTADGATVLSDDVESGANGWTAQGFTIISGTVSKQVPQYYLAENRVYDDYDAALKTGPYNFGNANTKPNWVERFPYQNGLLVWYSDGEFTDNNTSVHPGGGLVLPVDARPEPIRFPDGALLGNRRQPFDATFGRERTDAVTFHRNGQPVVVPSRPGIPTFDDTDPNRYWSADNPWASTKVAGTGTRITVDYAGYGGQRLNLTVSQSAQ